MKQFTIPFTYRSNFISAIKEKRKEQDKMKKDFTPTLVDCGNLKIYLSRHFGFCYGVENAIEIAFRTIEENKGKRIFLLSEMIHNPQVNQDLLNMGVQFLQDTKGNRIIDFDTLTADDVVIIPAFGTTLAIESELKDKGLQLEAYETTCPFVEKVWKRSEQISNKDFSIIIHGKATHEETRATFSHAAANGPALVIQDMKEAELLALIMKKEKSIEEFYSIFQDRYSPNFNPDTDLQRIGVVNQTTMLATETQAISEFLKGIAEMVAPPDKKHVVFADTRDTLCYATNDNQSAAYGLLEKKADLAIVVGGYNSSNTSHLVELAEHQLPTYFIESDKNLISTREIIHYDLNLHKEIITENWLPSDGQVTILLTSGASCPDKVIEEVIEKLLAIKQVNLKLDEIAV